MNATTPVKTITEAEIMAILKCKMCGGTLEITEGQTVCECEYCGTNQTVTTAKDENLQALFNRANILRMKSEFDKAENLYEKLIQSSPDDPEAHWGLILCKFGIEYVEDPKTYKRIPTCHRTSFDSIISDEDYREALRCADPIQRELYESEAKEIDRIQKEILALSAKEEPYDVFICYKETDEKGSRTPDSVIANDIYYQLTNEGFKVFYSAITLEDKLGSAYEPCIFAALNSAKVMLAVGTKPEHFNAVWVKNEWSRFLKMMKKDRSKMLIPCYKNMDAYELPEEFAHLQAQDMSKIGFINDLTRGIKKIIKKEKPEEEKVVKNVISTNTSEMAVPILKRVFLCLEDRDFQKADTLLEQVFNLDPECSKAYIAKMMSKRKISSVNSLYSLDFDLNDDSLYTKALRFADDKYKSVLEEYRDESLYRKASLLFSENTKDKYVEAKNLYNKIADYRDSRNKIESCIEKLYDIAADLVKKAENKSEKIISAVGSPDKIEEYFLETEEVWLNLGSYRDSEARLAECKILKSEALYKLALNIKKTADVTNDEQKYTEAQQIFAELSEYKDSKEFESYCQNHSQLAHNNKAYRDTVKLCESDDLQSIRKASTQFKKLGSFKDSASKHSKCDTKYKKIMTKNTLGKQLAETDKKQAEIHENITSLDVLLKQWKTRRIMGIITLVYIICPITMVFLILNLHKGLSNYYIDIIYIAFSISMIVGIIIGIINALCLRSPLTDKDNDMSCLSFLIISVLFLMGPGIIYFLLRGIFAIFIPYKFNEKKHFKYYENTNSELKELSQKRDNIAKEINKLAEEINILTKELSILQ